MTRALTRTHFHSSRLIRTLAELAVLEQHAPATAFAERLALWIDFADAIALCAVHNANGAGPAGALAESSSGAHGSVGEDFARTRARLENAITQGGAPHAGRTQPKLPTLAPGVSAEDASAYEPYRRYHLAQQRDMESGVRSLREKMRGVVGAASPKLKQLVALDAAFDAILVERESHLLSTLPSLLKKRFSQLHQAHQQALADVQTDSPERWMKPGGWLARFRSELQTVLLAELELRLQPSLGLLEAFNNEKTQPI